MKISFRSWKEEKKRRATRRNLNKKIRENYKPNRQPPERNAWGVKIERRLCPLTTSQDKLGLDLSLKSAVIMTAQGLEIKMPATQRLAVISRAQELELVRRRTQICKSARWRQLREDRLLESLTHGQGCYAFFDKSGNCLYVGKSNWLHNRIQQHRYKTPFFNKVKTIAYWVVGNNERVGGWFPLEAALIGYYKPKHNKKDVPEQGSFFFIPHYCAFKPEYLKSIIAGKN